MYTKIEVRAYTRVLKKKLLELKKEREKKIKQFAKDAAAWRRLVLEWIDLNAEVRVMAIRDSQLHTRHYGYARRIFDDTFLKDSPQPPHWPSNERIQKIQAMLRHLSLLPGTSKIDIQTENVSDLLDGKSEED